MSFGENVCRCFVAVLVVCAVLIGASAARSADVDRGRQLAEQWCASCHLLPGAETTATQGLPSFREMAHGDKTADQLKLFLMRPHGAMPPLTLSRAEIDALVGYIESLR